MIGLIEKVGLEQRFEGVEGLAKGKASRVEGT